MPSRSGNSHWSNGPSSARVRGSSAHSSAALANAGAMSWPLSALPHAVVAKTRSSSGCTHGRSARASAALTVWMVPRISVMRTTVRSSIAADRSSVRKAFRRFHSARYGTAGTCPCSPTTCSTVSTTTRSERSSRSWRASVARPRAFRESVGCTPPF